jgi:hypothetical protein
MLMLLNNTVIYSYVFVCDHKASIENEQLFCAHAKAVQNDGSNKMFSKTTKRSFFSMYRDSQVNLSWEPAACAYTVNPINYAGSMTNFYPTDRDIPLKSSLRWLAAKAEDDDCEGLWR